MKKLLLNLLFIFAATVGIAQQFGLQGNATGTDTYLTSITNLTSYSVSGRGVVLHIKFANPNTGPATLKAGTLPTIDIVKDVSTPLSAGDIQGGKTYTLFYDGTNFQINLSASSGSGDVSGPASSTDGVPALFDGTTGKLLKNSTPTGTANPVMSASPTLTGDPLAPTPSPGDNDNSIVTSAFVANLALPAFSTVSNGFANLSGGAGNILKGDNTWITPGTSGNHLISDGTNWISANPFPFTRTSPNNNITTGSITATANSQYGYLWDGTHTLRNNATDNFSSYRISTNLIANANNQVLRTFVVDGAYTLGAFTGSTRTVFSAQSAGTEVFIVDAGTTSPVTIRGAGISVASGGGINMAGGAPATSTITLTSNFLINGIGLRLASGTTSVLGVQTDYPYVPTTSSATGGVSTEVKGSYTPANGTVANTPHVALRVVETVNNASGGSGQESAILHLERVNTNITNVNLTGIVVEDTNDKSGFGTGDFPTNKPHSTVQVNGSFATGYVAKTGTYTATANDNIINCTANTFTVTLPTAVGIAGRQYTIVNSGAGTITVDTTLSQTFVNVTATPTSLVMATIGSRTVVSNGAEWLLTSSL